MPKKYSEEDVRELLYEALQLQEEARAREHAASGLTLEEVSEIAEEVGIDPAFIVAAAHKSAEEDSYETKTGVLGQTKEMTMRSTVEGALSDDRIETIVRRLRKVMGSRGTLRRTGNGFEWEATRSDGEHVLVRVESDDETSDVTLIQNPRKTAGGAWVPPLMPLIFPLVILLSGGPIAAFVMFTLFASLMTVMAFSGTRKKIKASDARDRRKLEGVLSGIESILASGETSKVEPETAKQTGGRIDPSLLEPSDDSQAVNEPARSSRREVS